MADITLPDGSILKFGAPDFFSRGHRRRLRHARLLNSIALQNEQRLLGAVTQGTETKENYRKSIKTNQYGIQQQRIPPLLHASVLPGLFPHASKDAELCPIAGLTHLLRLGRA